MIIPDLKNTRFDTISAPIDKKTTPLSLPTPKTVSNDQKPPAFKKIKMPSNYTIAPRKNRIRKDGKAKLQLTIVINKQRVRHPLDIWIPFKKWDDERQLVSGRTNDAKDKNLEIAIVKNRINEILIAMRLKALPIDAKVFISRLEIMSSDEDFIHFWEQELIRQKGLVQNTTLRQQKSILAKLKAYRSVVPFSNLDIKFVEGWMSWMRLTRKNCDTTVYVALKSLRKYVNLAIASSYVFPLNPNQIKIRSTQSIRTFLSREELKLYDIFYFSPECYGPTKDSLRRFLFSCYTGLRISDINSLGKENIQGDILFFKSKKAGKIQRIQLSKKSVRFLYDTTFTNSIFPGTKNTTMINRELKAITARFGIDKNISFHCARHTFATQFLELGGDVTVLQKLLGHSNIRETMIYVHITPTRKSEGLGLFDLLD